jgi:acyl dehydratase
VPLDQSFVGHVEPLTRPYRVSREKIGEFARAINDANPAYVDAAAAAALGYPDVIAPPTFAFVITYPASEGLLANPALGLDFTKVVHGEQRFEYRRPLHAGDEVRVRLSVESIKAMAGNDVLLTRADIVTTDGEGVASTYMTLVARGTAA